MNIVDDCYLVCEISKDVTDWVCVLRTICVNRKIFSEEPQNRLNIFQNFDVYGHTRTHEVRLTIIAHDWWQTTTCQTNKLSKSSKTSEFTVYLVADKRWRYSSYTYFWINLVKNLKKKHINFNFQDKKNVLFVSNFISIKLRLNKWLQIVIKKFTWKKKIDLHYLLS